MESRVEVVWLRDKVTLDIGALIEYTGQGKCRGVVCYNDTAARYREDLKTWAQSKNWQVTIDCRDCFRMNK